MRKLWKFCHFSSQECVWRHSWDVLIVVIVLLSRTSLTNNLKSMLLTHRWPVTPLTLMMMMSSVTTNHKHLYHLHQFHPWLSIGQNKLKDEDTGNIFDLCRQGFTNVHLPSKINFYQSSILSLIWCEEWIFADKICSTLNISNLDQLLPAVSPASAPLFSAVTS